MSLIFQRTSTPELTGKTVLNWLWSETKLIAVHAGHSVLLRPSTTDNASKCNSLLCFLQLIPQLVVVSGLALPKVATEDKSPPHGIGSRLLELSLVDSMVITQPVIHTPCHNVSIMLQEASQAVLIFHNKLQNAAKNAKLVMIRNIKLTKSKLKVMLTTLMTSILKNCMLTSTTMVQSLVLSPSMKIS